MKRYNCYNCHNLCTDEIYAKYEILYEEKRTSHSHITRALFFQITRNVPGITAQLPCRIMSRKRSERNATLCSKYSIGIIVLGGAVCAAAV